MIELTKEQQFVIDGLMQEINSAGLHKLFDFRDSFITTVGGYAGTGKTTLIASLRDRIRKYFPRLSVAFLAFTGKASAVLKHKLLLSCDSIDYCGDYIGTIHGLIYSPETKWDKQLKTYVITGWKLRHIDEIGPDIFIIDEASMVSKKIWQDLTKFKRPIIAIGDHGQLPPIGDNFNLIEHTDFKLTKIHRQALNSPIISLSKWVREEGYIPDNRIFSDNVFKLNWNHPKCQNIWNNKIIFDENLIILTAFNTTRRELNKQIRDRFDYKKLIPYPGERIVCLQNDHTRGIMNGQIGTLLWVMGEDHELYRMTIQLDYINDPVECTVANKCFDQVSYTIYDNSKKSKKQHIYAIKKGIEPINYFDYGYVISVHKSQGSEWDKVIMFEQRSRHWDDAYYTKWLYTGITRSREKLFIISDYWG